MPDDLRFGNRRILKMDAQINELRRAIEAEDSPSFGIDDSKLNLRNKVSREKFTVGFSF